jgi:hypothetical protein
MRSPKCVAIGLALTLVAACSTTYKSRPQMTYGHGQKVPDLYISIIKASPGEIEFRIQVKFVATKMYHLILEGNEPVAQGWFSTQRAGGEAYTVKMKPEEGKTFEPGKTYRLCVGDQSPEAVQMTSNNYVCRIDYTFVFQEKEVSP